MYELIIFSLLMRAPRHGYLLAKITNDKIGPWARVSNGTLYPLLARLERDGYITTSDGASGCDEEGAPRSSSVESGATDRTCRRYTITARGRQRFHALMLDTTSNLSDYQRVFRQKVPALHLLAPAERNYLLDHYLSYCETCILHYERVARDLERKASVPAMVEGVEGRELVQQLPAHEAGLLVVARQAEEWRAELAWARGLRERAWPVDLAHMLSTVSMRPPERRGRFPGKRGAGAGTEQGGQGGDEHAHA